MKTKWDEWNAPDKLALVQTWAEKGLSEKQIAHNMGIAYSTFKDWKNKHSAFSALLKKSKRVIDEQVENSLLTKALGFTKTVTKPVKVKEVKYSKEGKRQKEVEKVVMVEEQVYVPPDTTAMIFWLKNRLPKDWANDPHLLELKKKDLKLKEKKINQDEW